ncbi:unnamed protein product [Mytilus coruscus]|uniref:YqaJ viral recombinase domain-containing protein n=1 Tax=Mytilus coruscus TaxID=42192 RepID=A0A6J8BIB0_MYTCO|nr:unnamed protein product [Mytilus coruscus]
MGSILRDNKPVITVLTEPNRPMRIGDKFSEMYENEWTHAYSVLEDSQFKEIETIGILIKILRRLSDDEIKGFIKVVTDSIKINTSKYIPLLRNLDTALVCRTPIDNPSKSLLKDICYPANNKFSSKETEWGCEHESMVRHHYFTEMSKKHENFEIKDVGFMIDPRYLYMRTSSNGKASCDCCEKDMFVERISGDTSLCQDILSKSEAFFKRAVLPELIGKLYSRPLRAQPVLAVLAFNSTNNTNTNSSTTNQEIICICRKEFNEDTDDVIDCDNENCP